jgi:large subunit ribosomal protein L24
MQKIKKNDNVMILAGKDNGKTGKVEKVIVKESKVLVEGINVVKRHVKGREGMEGGVIDLIKPVDISNVALVCPHCGKPTRVGFDISQDEKQRVCKKCKKII